MKQKLDDLPPSIDEFWEGAEVHTNLEPKNMFDQVHYFERIAGHQAQCTHCSWGFQLDPGDKIIEGHLLDKNNKKII
jgi:hypothetical protein